MHETTIDISHSRAQSVAPMTIAQQLSQQLAAVNTAMQSHPSEALAGIVADGEVVLSKHAALEAQLGPAILATGAGQPGAADRLKQLRAQLAESEDLMRGSIQYAKAYLEQHAQQVADSYAQHLADVASAINAEAEADVQDAAELDRLGVAYHEVLQRRARRGRRRERAAAELLVERHRKDFNAMMDASLSIVPRLRGFNHDTAQTFHRFVARAIEIMGNDVPGLLHDPRLAYCEGPRDWAVIAAEHASHIADQFGPKQ